MTTALATEPIRPESAVSAHLTKLVLNPVSRSVQSDLRNSTALHRRIMKLFPDGLGDTPRARAGVLFRLETDGIGTPTILLQSRVAPDTSQLPAGYTTAAQTRDMQALLTALRPGLHVRYRLVGNAVRRCGRNSTDGRWKQAIPLRGVEADHWWIDRATAAGLIIHTVTSETTDPLTGWHRSKNTQPASSTTARRRADGLAETQAVPHHAARFEGTAAIRDADALRHSLLQGIGRSKSYGCGLLSLAPATMHG
ncbi:type I-E CRISPR-associated protein Cas6/Cse3/CasE [Streptomyces xiamenensis]|uniref:type I-E CRISPR-associated protein Cas6/Cse3/CasE n=1 Tax=Streptomyces TaxID=1883 RepID=UPI000693FE04|nr:type I-E CRISPR-associated protein Cas6/Cse3/CasE [Streptomyces sp. NRRL F-2890]